jgi:hypothetical protein
MSTPQKKSKVDANHDDSKNLLVPAFCAIRARIALPSLAAKLTWRGNPRASMARVRFTKPRISSIAGPLPSPPCRGSPQSSWGSPSRRAARWWISLSAARISA